MLGVVHGLLIVAQPEAGKRKQVQAVGLLGLAAHERQRLGGPFHGRLVIGLGVVILPRPVPHLARDLGGRRAGGELNQLVGEFFFVKRRHELAGGGALLAVLCLAHLCEPLPHLVLVHRA